MIDHAGDFMTLAMCAILILVAFLVFTLPRLPRTLASTRQIFDPSQQGQATEVAQYYLDVDRQNFEVRRTIAQSVLGLFVVFTAYSGWRSLKDAEEKQITDHFSAAITHLESTSAAGRIGGI